MDTAQPIINNFDTTSPAHLLVGPHDSLIEHTEQLLQACLCQHGGCGSCITCQQIRMHQHHAVEWLKPEKQYTREDLEPLFNKIGFTLNEGEKSFFIIQHADALTISCANSLLKSLEEPGAGYYFILLAQRIDQILPTIRSRCTVHHVSGIQTVEHQEIFDYLTDQNSPDALLFIKILEQSKINERESIELLDNIFRYWIAARKKAVINNDAIASNRINTMLHFLQHASENPPMPGSSKLFWKNIFLQSII